MRQKIILNRNPGAKCWTALFFRVPRMPEAQELPLPYSSDCLDVFHVASGMQVRFPQADVWFRNASGSVEYIGRK